MLNNLGFRDISQIVIDNFEGGYFHRNMLKDGRVKDPKGLMSAGAGRKDSGETLFGIDRVNGISLKKYPEWLTFWGKVDSLNAANTWKYNFKGGQYYSELKNLASDLMYKSYLDLSKKYLTPEAKAIIEGDKRLMIHLIYSVWNGEGWFSKYAKLLNEKIKNGEKNTDNLLKLSMNNRLTEGYKKGSSPNELIVNTAKKMLKLFEKIKPNEVVFSIFPIAIIALALFYIYKNN